MLFEPIAGLRDSKVLSEKRRIALAGQILDPTTALVVIEVVSAKHLRAFGHQKCWEDAIVKVADLAKRALTSVTTERNFEVVVDGSGSPSLKMRMPRARFEAKADDKYPEVSAASIVAKVERNIWMRELHAQYPVYGWDENYGYGTPPHIATLAKHGPCPEHRKIRGRT